MLQIPINVGDENIDPLYEYGYGITSFEDSPYGSPPYVSSASTTLDGSAIEITFNKAVDDPSADVGSFLVEIQNVGVRDITQINLKNNDSTTVLLTLEEPVEYGDEITVTYTPGNIRSWDGGVLAAFETEVYNVLNEGPHVHTIPGKIEAEDYYNMYGVQTEASTDINGGFNVRLEDNFSWIQYLVDVSEEGLYELAYRIAAPSQSGRITLSSSLGGLISAMDLPVTGGWQDWQNVTTTGSLQQGEQTFTLIASRGGFNINWIELIRQTGIIEIKGEPLTFKLKQNYPNPFNPVTNIRYEIPMTEHVLIKVFDLLGQVVAKPVNESKMPGNYICYFDGSGLASGLYFAQMRAGDFIANQKMMLVK